MEHKFETKNTTFFLGRKDGIHIMNKKTGKAFVVNEDDLYEFGEWYSDQLSIDFSENVNKMNEAYRKSSKPIPFSYDGPIEI